MFVELIQTVTSDGVQLHGALYPASRPPSKGLDVDAVVCLHGVGGNFYDSPLFDTLAVQLQQQGLGVLRVNTRGHDSVSLASTAAGPQRLGAAYETVSQCVHDVTAWCELARQRGYKRVGLLGHSLGAIKAIYAATHDLGLLPGWIVAMSPPRLSYQVFMTGPRRSRFQQTVEMAEANVAVGKPEALIQARFPFPLLITSAGYLEKYGPREEYNFLRFAHRLPCPTLFTYGQLELDGADVSFAGLPDLINNLPYESIEPQCVTIPHADHMYRGTFDRLSGEILHWLTS